MATFTDHPLCSFHGRTEIFSKSIVISTNLRKPEDLVSAFDRANAVLNRKIKDADDFDLERSLWLHIDYPITGSPPPFTCYQSFLNYVDCTTPGSPCLRVVPKSHTGPIWEAVQKFGRAKYGAKASGGFFRIDWHATEGVIVPSRDLVNVLAPPGSLVMWKSGLVHDARTSHIAPLPNHGVLRRLVAYVCHAPRALMSEHDRRIRVELFRAGIPSTHWPVWAVKDHHMVTSPRDEAGLAPYNLPRWNARQILRDFPIMRSLVPVTDAELDDGDVK